MAEPDNAQDDPMMVEDDKVDNDKASDKAVGKVQESDFKSKEVKNEENQGNDNADENQNDNDSVKASQDDQVTTAESKGTSKCEDDVQMNDFTNVESVDTKETLKENSDNNSKSQKISADNKIQEPLNEQEKTESTVTAATTEVVSGSIKEDISTPKVATEKSKDFNVSISKKEENDTKEMDDCVSEGAAEDIVKNTNLEEQNAGDASPDKEIQIETPKYPHAGRTFQRKKMNICGDMRTLQGEVVNHTEQDGRYPARWGVQWQSEPRTDCDTLICHRDEWVEKNFEELEQHTPVKLPLEVVYSRYQDVVNDTLESSDIISNLLLMAAFEEGLEASIQESSHRMEEQGVESTTPHPPLYYSTNPSSYLQPPTIDNNPKPTNHATAMTPANLAHRVRAGCQWAWNYLADQQPPPPPPPPQISATSSRRRLRQPKPFTVPTPTVPKPLPVQRGGRVAIWWLHELGLEERPQQATVDNTEPDDVVEPNDDNNNSADIISADKVDSSTSDNNNNNVQEKNGTDGIKKNSEAIDSQQTESKGLKNDATIDESMKVQESVANGNNDNHDDDDEDDDDDDDDESSSQDKDENYSLKSEQIEDDEELEGVEKERGRLSPVPQVKNKKKRKRKSAMKTEGKKRAKDTKCSSTAKEIDKEKEETKLEEEEEEEIDEAEITHNNPYIRQSPASFLEILAKPKALSATDIQEAMCKCTLRVRHNKRQAPVGVETSSLIPVDEVVLARETPNHPPGKVVLKCLSGETFAELQRSDPQAFSRAKFALDVIGDLELTQLAQRQQELLWKEAEFKKEKAWHKARFKAIHEGYTIWPLWQDSVITWLDTNITAMNDAVEESTPENNNDNNGNNNDAEVAKSLEETEGTGRRRTTRRAATSSGAEGVFYGNQSQLTQKQLMDAIVRLVKANRFQTLTTLQSLVADESTNPLRRSRIALGRLVYKRNQLSREQVNTEWSDSMLLKLLADQPLIVINENLVPAAPGSDKNAETAVSDTTEASKSLIAYLQDIHWIELRLRSLILKHLSQIPIPIVATAADERVGTMESMDISEFEDPSTIEWENDGHELVGRIIYRPSETQNTDALSPCKWYKIYDYAKAIASSNEDQDDTMNSSTDPEVVERRVRLRAIPIDGPNEDDDTGIEDVNDHEVLILTEAQVWAGIKASAMEQAEQQQRSFNEGNPFADGMGSKITLVPVDDDNDDDDEIEHVNGTIVGHDNSMNEDGTIDYRILVLPERASMKGQRNNNNDDSIIEAFWASLDDDADDNFVCRPIDNMDVAYAIQHADYHSSSPAYRECVKVLEYLKNKSNAGPFMEPVDPVALNIPQYFDYIKHPMDISTMEQKLENGDYARIPPKQTVGLTPITRMLNGPFRKDIELMFDNAIYFNPPDDWIHQAAISLKKEMIKKIADISTAADNKTNGGGKGRKRYSRSVYMEVDSDVDMYEDESDNDDVFDGKSRRRSNNRKKKKSTGSSSSGGGGNRRSGPVKDDLSIRAIEHAIRLQGTMTNPEELGGPFANLPVHSDATSFTLPCDWGCRSRLECIVKDDAPPTTLNQKLKRTQEMAELVALQKESQEMESSRLRRSTRGGPTISNESPRRSPSSNYSKSKAHFTVEYFPKDMDGNEITDLGTRSGGGGNTTTTTATTGISTRLDVEYFREKRHENYYCDLYQQYHTLLTVTTDSEQLGANNNDSNSYNNYYYQGVGLFANNAFPPYLGSIVLGKHDEATWEIRTPFLVPAIRWVIRGLIGSGHLTALEQLNGSDVSSGVIIPNDIYFYDPNMKPFDVVDQKELQRRKRANKSEDEESEEEDVELSEYEKLRAQRVARNAERLKALGLG